MIKPPKMNIKSRSTMPTVVATTTVRKITAMKRHKDVDARWKANRTRSWARNLKRNKPNVYLGRKEFLERVIVDAC